MNKILYSLSMNIYQSYKLMFRPIHYTYACYVCLQLIYIYTYIYIHLYIYIYIYKHIWIGSKSACIINVCRIFHEGVLSQFFAEITRPLHISGRDQYERLPASSSLRPLPSASLSHFFCLPSALFNNLNYTF